MILWHKLFIGKPFTELVYDRGLSVADTDQSLRNEINLPEQHFNQYKQELKHSDSPQL